MQRLQDRLKDLVSFCGMTLRLAFAAVQTAERQSLESVDFAFSCGPRPANPNRAAQSGERQHARPALLRDLDQPLAGRKRRLDLGEVRRQRPPQGGVPSVSEPDPNDLNTGRGTPRKFSEISILADDDCARPLRV